MTTFNVFSANSPDVGIHHVFRDAETHETIAAPAADDFAARYEVIVTHVTIENSPLWQHADKPQYRIIFDHYVRASERPKLP